MPIAFAVRLARILPALAAAAVLNAAAAEPLSLAGALRIAETRSPQLAAQRAAAEAAASLVGPASQNPDPRLVFGLDNVPVEGGDKWSLTADSMTMRRVGVMQDFARGAKRELRGTRAEAEARREAAMIEMQRADLRRDVATAWIERAYATRSLALVARLSGEAGLASATAPAEVAAGRLGAGDALASRALAASLGDRRLDLERQARRAEAVLSRWIGAEAGRPAGDVPDVLALPHHADLERDLERHPHIAIYAPLEAAARAEADLARAATQPDWNVELVYAQRGSAHRNMVSLMVRVDLPLFAAKRQDPVAAAKLRQVDQVRAQSEEAVRRHVAEIRASLVDWEGAKARLVRHRGEIVPIAEERARLATAAYQGARGELSTVLEARRGVLEARLAALAVELEVARAWAQLAYLVPEGSPQ